MKYRYIKYLLRLLIYYPADLILYLLTFKKKFGIKLGGYSKASMYPGYLSSHNAKRGIESFALEYVKGNALDIGAGANPLRGTRSIDNNKEENAYNILEKDNSVDFVFSSHCFEHLDVPNDCIKEISRVLKNDGILLIYLPHPACELWSKKVNENHVSFFGPTNGKKFLRTKGLLYLI